MSPYEPRHEAQPPGQATRPTTAGKAAQRPRRALDTCRWRVAAYIGSITRSAEVRNTSAGNPWLLFGTVADGVRLADEAAALIRVEYFAPL